MRIRFYCSAKEREQKLARYLSRGMAKVGDHPTITTLDLVKTPVSVEIVHRADWDLTCDVAFMVGVKNLRALEAHREAGIPVVYIDKGYTRHQGCFRIAFDAHQPTDYLMTQDRPDDRRKLFGWTFPGWRVPKPKGTILIAGSGMKYHHMNNLGHPTDYGAELIAEIRKHSKSPIVYRPKPSWKESVPIPGSIFSREKEIAIPLAHANVLITYGSNACFEATMSGVPSIILGDAVARDISSRTIVDLAASGYVYSHANVDTVTRWLNNLAYAQWTYEDFEDGSVWRFVRDELCKRVSGSTRPKSEDL